MLVPAVVRNTWIDADAQRHKGDDGRRCSLRLRSGVLLYTVRVSDVEPVETIEDEEKRSGVRE